MKKLALVAAISLAASGQSMAAGFQLIEQSVSGMGTAYAGGSAQAQDASTVYFNPAGMTKIKGSEFVAAAHIIVPQAEFTDGGSSISAAAGGGSLGTNTGGNAGVPGAAPNMYLTHQYNDKLTVGLGINAPFGMATEYDSSWIGRYHAVKSEIMTININPSVAFKVSDKLSIGLGLNAQYIDATLSNAIDFATLDNIPAAGGAAIIAGAPGTVDGFVTLAGDDWGFGYNLGFLFDASDNTRIGLHYRSKIKYKLTGNADFTVPAAAAAYTGGGLFTDTTLSSNVELPATLSMSLFHQVNPEWAVMADISRTYWHSVQELRFDFDSVQPDGVTTLKWKDSNRYSIGATYSPAGKMTYRVGVAFDETPIPSSTYRTPRVPGEDRTWLAFGMGYKKSDNLSFEFGYAHLFVKDPTLNKTDTLGGEDTVRGNLIGSYDSSVDILSAQMNYRF